MEDENVKRIIVINEDEDNRTIKIQFKHSKTYTIESPSWWSNNAFAQNMTNIEDLTINSTAQGTAVFHT